MTELIPTQKEMIMGVPSSNKKKDETTNNKYSFVLELIKNMDFLSINTNEDWYETLSFTDKKNIKKGIDDIENGRIHSHEDVITFAKNKIAALKNNR